MGDLTKALGITKTPPSYLKWKYSKIAKPRVYSGTAMQTISTNAITSTVSCQYLWIYRNYNL